MDIVRRRFSFRSKYDDVVIRGICLIPEHSSGIFQMVHGMNEHKERYLSFMEYMAGKGYVTLMHDNRGMAGACGISGISATAMVPGKSDMWRISMR